MANLSSKIQGVSQAAMPVITPWTDATPWLPNTGTKGTVTTDKLRTARVGDSLHLRWDYEQTTGGTAGSGTYSFTLPNGLVADTTKVSISGDGDKFGHVGRAWIFAGTTRFQGDVYLLTSTTLAVRALQEVTGYSSFAAAAALNFSTANLSVNFYDVIIPIVGWESGTLQTANTYQVEYAYNSSGITAAATSDTTSFAYGAGGVAIGSIAQQISGNAATTFRVRFRSTIQPTDQLILEVDNGTGGANWSPVGNSYINGYVAQGPASFGAGFNIVNSTDVDVTFGNGGRQPTNVTYSNGGQTWSGVSTWRWRMRKVAGGIQGFGNATTTTPGLVTLAQLTPTTGWTTYTPTVSGVTGSATGVWRREGDSIRVRVDITATGTSTSNVYASLPTGLTASVASIAVSVGSTLGVVGHGHHYKSSIDFRALTVYMDSTTQFGFVDDDEGSGILTSGEMVSGDHIAFDALVGVNEWAGSLPGLVSDSQVEFVYNSSTSTSTDSTSFATGSGGVLFQNFAPAGTANVSKRVRFSSAIQTTDQVVLEVQMGEGPWVPAPNTSVSFAANDAGTTYYGCRMFPVTGSTTDVDVLFHSAAAPAVAWSVVTGLSFKWRVKKVKSSISALVDNATATTYGSVKGGKVPGQTDASTIAAGNIGEKLTFTQRTINGASGGWIAHASALTTLTPGVWLVFGDCQTPPPTSTANSWYAAISTDSSNASSNLIGQSYGSLTPSATTVGNGAIGQMPVAYVNVSTNTPIYAKAYSEDISSSNITVGGFAVRIA